MINFIKDTFFKYRMFLGVLLAVSTVSGSYGYLRGKYSERVSCVQNQSNVAQKEVKNNVKISSDVRKMSDVDLDRALSEWMH